MPRTICLDLLDWAGDGGLRARFFVAACAVRMTPVVDRVCQSASRSVVARVLESVWNSHERATGSATLVTALRALPEASIGDSHDPRYYGMRALGLVNDAALGADGANGELVLSASQGALDLAGDLDALLSSTLRLAEAENAAQLELVQLMLQDGRPRREAIMALALARRDSIRQAVDLLWPVKDA